MKKNKKRRNESRNPFQFDPSDLIGRHTKKITNHVDLCSEFHVDPITKHSGPGLLKEMSAKNIEEEPLSQSIFAHQVVRECEKLMEKYESHGVGDGITTERDIERLERRADDFVLRSRSTMDIEHKKALWAARCKLALLRTTMHKHDVEEGSDTASTNIDSMRSASKLISEEMLARWMHENQIGDPSVVRFHAGKWQHAIDACGLSALWSTIRSVRDRWPHLNLSPYLYVIVDKLRSRVAFFMNYIEVVNHQIEREREFKRVKILGLSRSNWHAADPSWVRGSKYTGAPERAVNQSLLNSPELTRTETIDGRDYICINDDFIEETERVINSMLVEIRKCAGFEWHDNPGETECDCLACAELVGTEASNAEMERAMLNLQKLVSDEMEGRFRDYLQMEFRKHVWDNYVQVGERELFAQLRPLDSQSSQSVISRGRPADGKGISRRLCERTVKEVWSDFTKESADGIDDQARVGKVLIDYTSRRDPAYSLMTRLALGFHIDSISKGARLVIYLIDCHASNDPFTFSDERFNKHRNVFDEFHTVMETTGTLAWRYNYQRRVGLRAPNEEIYYEHPLIMRTMSTFCVLYSGRMHLCQNFAEAFLVWLAVMCEDARICGEVYTDVALFDLYERVFPGRSKRIASIKNRIEVCKNKWDPTSRLFPTDLRIEKKSDKATLQF